PKGISTIDAIHFPTNGFGVSFDNISTLGPLQFNEATKYYYSGPSVLMLSKLTPNPDRKSTRLNSSHVEISYSVFCLKKKKTYLSKLLPSRAIMPVMAANHIMFFTHNCSVLRTVRTMQGGTDENTIFYPPLVISL